MAYERSAFIGDIHVPYQDEEALRTALAFLKVFKPNVVFLLGDVVDFYSLSWFDRDPNRLFDLQKDLDVAHDVLKRIRAVGPRANIFLLKGNHEHRLTKFLRRKAPEMEGLRSLRLETLLGFKKLRINYIEQSWMKFHGFLVKHGNIARAKSGYSATGELEKAGISGLSGHTHRLGKIYRTNYGGMFTWVEAGCLCDLNPEYMEGQIADWAHGLAYGMFKQKDRRFVIHTTPIINGKIVFEGREIRDPFS